MSYLKLCGIYDTNGQQWPTQINGLNYAEDCYGTVTLDNKSFPMNVLCEVINYVTESDFPYGTASNFTQEPVTIPDNSLSVRQSCYNQLVVTYPSLVM